MVNDEGNVEGAGGVPPSGGPEDSRDVSLENQGGGMGVVIGGGGIGGGRYMSYGGIHFGSRRLPLRIILGTSQFMNCARKRSRFRCQVDSFGGGTRTLTWRRRGNAQYRDQIGR